MSKNESQAPPSLSITQESYRQLVKLEYAEYLLADPRYREVLCFEGTKPKNLVYMRLDQILRRLKPEWIVYRLVELGLFYEVVLESYLSKECRKECVQKKGRKCLEYTTVCEEVTKNIEGIMPSDELLKVCRSLGYRSPP